MYGFDALREKNLKTRSLHEHKSFRVGTIILLNPVSVVIKSLVGGVVFPELNRAVQRSSFSSKSSPQLLATTKAVVRKKNFLVS